MRPILIIIATLLCLTGCGTYATPDWTATPSLEPTDTAVPTATSTPTPTPSATPTATAAPTNTPTASATPVPTATATMTPTVEPTEDTTSSLPQGDATAGEVLFRQGKGAAAPPCITCHQPAQSPFALGPVMTGIAERASARVEGLTAEAYIHQSIVEPDAYLVPGFRPVMPGVYDEHLTEQEIADIIAYLMTR